jgi:hypothetical protein
MTPDDAWVGKTLQYPTKDYRFVLRFPSSWNAVRVTLQPPGAVAENEVLASSNTNHETTFAWKSDPNHILPVGTRIVIHFDWPPLYISSIDR